MASHIIIGLGGTGFRVLREFRKRLWEKYPNAEDRHRQPIRMLYVDSDENTAPTLLIGKPEYRVNGQDTAITQSEYLGIKNVEVNTILNNLAAYPNLQHVVGNAELTKTHMGNIGAAAAQKRRAGRIMFAANIQAFNQKIEAIQGELQQAVHDPNVTFYVIAGLAGGTGSGSVVDAVAQLISRQPDAKVEVFTLLPERIAPKQNMKEPDGNYDANGYAALSELSALNIGAWKPCDVATGAPEITLLGGRAAAAKQFGLTVFTDTNENGVVVNTLKEMPVLLGNMLFFRTQMDLGQEAANELDRAFKSENGEDNLKEFRTDTRPNVQPVEARTRAIGSFGFKTVSYPSAKLTDHAAATAAKVITRTVLYRNWDANLGYLDHAPAQVPDYGEYLAAENLKNWKLSDANLTLSAPILPNVNGLNPTPFREFWYQQGYEYETANDFGMALEVADNLFQAIYNGVDPQNGYCFREEKGVEAYFNAKAAQQVVNDSAAAIIDSIKNDLFRRWQAGELSATDVQRVARRLLEYLTEKQGNKAEEIVTLDNQIAGYQAQKDYLRNRYLNATIPEKLLGRKKDWYYEYLEQLRAEYTARTQRASRQIFQHVLLPRLVNLFTDLQTEIQAFVGAVNDVVEKYGELVNSSTPEQPDLTKSRIEVGDMAGLTQFERNLLLDRNEMDGLAQIYRDALAEGTNRSFARMAYKLRSDNAARAAADSITTTIRNIHAQINGEHPVLGLNVLQQLYTMYGNDTNALNLFAANLITNCGVFVSLNQEQLGKHMPGSPGVNPKYILHITLPTWETDDPNKQQFVATFKQYLLQAYGHNVMHIEDGGDPETITFIAYVNQYPARCINHVAWLRDRYNERINHPTQQTAEKNRMVIHSQGDGSYLPDLFGEGNGPTGDAVIKYLFLAAAFGLLRQGTDDYGHEGWGYTKKDTFGAEQFTLYAPTFTGVKTAENLTQDDIQELGWTVDDRLAANRHVDEINALKSNVIAMMRDVVLAETGSPNTDTYRRYATQAEAAMNALNN